MQCLLIVGLCIIAVCQWFHNYKTKKRLLEISNVLDDVKNGNLDRRLLAKDNKVLNEIIYKINEIIAKDKNQFMKIEDSEKTYKKLVTSLSHDIRTPLASLIGYLEVLERGSISKDEQDKFLKTAKSKACNLNEYINSLFEWLKLESGEWTYHFEEENVCELSRIILADWVFRLEKNNIQFHFDIPDKSVNIFMDKNVFERILSNLLSNSIKHSHADYLGLVLYEKNGSVIIEIKDNGIGISDEDLPFVFDRLFKCDNARTGNSNGLGLAITKELVTLSKGSISVTSKIGIGTTFTMQFPININKE